MTYESHPNTGAEEPAEDDNSRPPGAEGLLSMITDAEKAFDPWQGKAENIEKRYANLEALASVAGDREFQLFWANMEVLRPTIYQREPVPVVTQRFKDRNPVAREAAEMLERVLIWDVDDDELHETLKLVRDDLAIVGRGVSWVLDDGHTVHVDRTDFVHDPARKWPEVSWVARRAFLTRDQFRDRFPDADWQMAKFQKYDDKGETAGADEYQPTEDKCPVWEMWHRADQMVYWITEGLEDVLDASEPLIRVKGFFPCPKPAYATCERRTLKPVPDYTYYRDQLDEINELTARISGLAESLRLKGFYASGASEVGEAIEAAMAATDQKAILVPVSSMAALGGASMKDSIIWLPVREVAEVITSLVALRKQLIEDVYEISGISDIMRGETVASETATAQNLKAQYGSVRVRERQAEMARVSRDVIRIKGEIFAETMDAMQLAEIAQMQLPTMMQVQQQMAMQQQMQQAMQQDPQAMQGGPQQGPEPIDPEKMVTIEQVGELLANQKTRPFVLDIETDSTIAPNEMEEKRSRNEFVQVIGGFIQAAGTMVQQQPETAKFATEIMKFAAGAYRAGRTLDAALDEFVDTVEDTAKQALQNRGQPSPEAQAEQAKMQIEVQRTQAEMQEREQRLALDSQKAQVDTAAKQEQTQMDAAMKSRELDLKAGELEIKRAELEIKSAEMGFRGEDMQLKAREQAVTEGQALVQHVIGMAEQDKQHMEEIMAKVDENKAATDEALTSLAEQQAQQTQLLQQGLEMIAQALSSPKRVVRDGAGTVVGVETIQ